MVLTWLILFYFIGNSSHSIAHRTVSLRLLQELYKCYAKLHLRTQSLATCRIASPFYWPFKPNILALDHNENRGSGTRECSAEETPLVRRSSPACARPWLCCFRRGFVS